ncbi:ABC transporter substrate-binding protein [Thermococcus thioreducens]|uniref:Iron complex transport system substrate-binding protein n=1 Tax=Thermococcus thioreducens TaxID=277988 RepID=A0A0Q2M4U2_9EURY|nr:helical backbone metal receptor [Thermococcus thioreducens]ASJ12309.1 vitamin B12 transporter [Thermococcus thioreducens]KQH83041.1 vitamin B12 transporter [Thermococcus thioreducens]SEV93106.1 iron complex transport system substrate-binding protein [Thermococcus thioreducens]
MKKTALLLMLLLFGAVIAAGCIGGNETPSSTSQPSSPTETSTTTPQTSSLQTSTEAEKPLYPVTVTDFANRTVTIEKEPLRVVTLAPSITEDLYYLGLFDRVVGVTDYDDFPPEVANVTRVGGYGKYANLEVIASLNPDLILVDSYSTPILSDLERIAPVVVVDPHSLRDIPKALELLGEVFNVPGNAQKAVAEFHAKINATGSAVTGKPKLKVFYVVWSNPLMTAGGDTFISDVISLAGGENVFKDTSGWPTVSMEQVLERDPDVIILTPHCGMTVQDVYKSILANTKAAREGRVYVIENENDLIHPSPRVVNGLETIAKLLHPDAFRVSYPLTITDFAGRQVTIEKEPERIVSLAPSITETLFYIGAGDKLVGVTKWADFPPAVENITRVGGYGQYANLEIIASLNPDLIIADGFSMSILNELEKIAPVVIVDPKNMSGIYRKIELLGEITNREEAARAVIAEMKAKVNYITSTVAGTSRPKVLFITWWNPLYVPGSGTFQDDLIRLAGGENIFSDMNGWAQVSLEQVLERNPDVIILSAHAGITAEELCNTPLINTNAFKNGMVFTISDDNLVSRPGPRIVHGLEEIAEYLHPDAFNYQPQPLVCNATAETGG